MSTLKVNTIQNTSGSSSSTPEQLEQGRAKMWANIKTTGTNEIRDSFNVTTVTDIAVGYYEVNFDRSMADANYTSLVTGDLRSPNTRSSGTDCNNHGTSSLRVSSEDNNSQYGQGRADVQIMCVCILGNT